MKPRLEHIGDGKNEDSFRAFVVDLPRFEFFWHYHPEYELTLIVQGRGRRLVGDSHARFEEGDLVFIGPGLPHTWVSDDKHPMPAKSVVIQFSEAFITKLATLQELSFLPALLNKATRAIVCKGSGFRAVAEQMSALPAASGVDRIAGLLHVLQGLAGLRTSHLASRYYHALKGQVNETRVNQVCAYVQRHANGILTIQKAAALVHLSAPAFCKFFKRATGQTFSDYVNDVRIANVCNQLIASDKYIAEIAFANGFETITYFNRVFFKKTGLRPREYRSRHWA